MLMKFVALKDSSEKDDLGLNRKSTKIAPSHRHHLKLNPSGGWGSTRVDFPFTGGMLSFNIILLGIQNL
jgi:hypothetical protein